MKRHLLILSAEAKLFRFTLLLSGTVIRQILIKIKEKHFIMHKWLAPYYVYHATKKK